VWATLDPVWFRYLQAQDLRDLLLYEGEDGMIRMMESGSSGGKNMRQDSEKERTGENAIPFLFPPPSPSSITDWSFLLLSFPCLVQAFWMT
jgi:hypothetical protein